VETLPNGARIGGIELGGTKIVCAVGSGPGERSLERREFPTGDRPAESLARVTDWLRRQEAAHGALQAIGIASFGPLDLAADSPTYGRITSTPKAGWSGTDLVGPFRREFGGLPIGFDTDVNGAALGEHLWGAAAGLDDFVYVTLGTGIGAGGMSGGRLLHGLVHPEMGHLRIPRLAGDDFAGACPYHGDCWEGLCSGPALRRRTGMAAEELPADHPAWPLTARYVGLALANLVFVLSPRRIVLGGSLRKGGRWGEETFFCAVREGLLAALNGYVRSPDLAPDGIERYLVPPDLGDDAGVCGALALGQRAIESPAPRR
jgi:fructokinase